MWPACSPFAYELKISASALRRATNSGSTCPRACAQRPNCRVTPAKSRRFTIELSLRDRTRTSSLTQGIALANSPRGRASASTCADALPRPVRGAGMTRRLELLCASQYGVGSEDVEVGLVREQRLGELVTVLSDEEVSNASHNISATEFRIRFG